MTSADHPSLSIVVCTYNRAPILAECLQSLVEQTASPDTYEVIIVDNNSTDSTREIAEGFVRRCSNFRVIPEPVQGLSHARNRGWSEARADWVAYIDDDAKASCNYVERMLHVISNYPFACFGGVYLPWYKYGRPRWFRDEYASNNGKLDRVGTLEDDLASGGVIAFNKSTLARFGGFPSHIGMNGKTLSYGEENFIQIRIREAGLAIGFDPDLVVHHLVSRNKMHPCWFIRSYYARGRDSCLASGNRAAWGEIFRTVKTACYDLAYYTITCTPKLMEDDYYLQNWLIDIFRRFAWHTGIMAGSLRIKWRWDQR
jgi:glycosyltransferase involved in cell wall biosynthesis